MNKNKLKIDEINNDKPMSLRFSPTAWAKLLFMRDIGDTEVGGFAITPEDDLLYVEDFFLPKQECSMATISFDDDSVANYMDDMVDKGLAPKQFMRIWIHTHPGMDTRPSGQDEETFERVFGNCNWAIMAIISDVCAPYCRLQVNDGPVPGSFMIPLEVDYSSYDFPASKSAKWLKEYKKNVTECKLHTYRGTGWPGSLLDDEDENDLDRLLTTMDIDDIIGSNPISDLRIDNEVLQHLTASQLVLLENMEESDREYAIDEIKAKIGIGD
jgi:proteasome lid subunit RPN8/RPN11